MIFLSHNSADKPVVEPVALRLKEIFGEDQVFYDSWSIQPGDGIIEKMNQGLSDVRYVFFFVSAKSLQSNMVKLEWQNALHKSTKGQCKIIPIRVDGSAMPPLLTQNLYIDMFSQGIEAAILQVVNVVQGNSTFTPQHMGFSNLSYSIVGDLGKSVEITISASHLMEPILNFIVLVTATENEIDFQLNGGESYNGGFNVGLKLPNGIERNGFGFRPMGGAITPSMPMRFKISTKNDAPLGFSGVLHQKSPTQWVAVPVRKQ